MDILYQVCCYVCRMRERCRGSKSDSEIFPYHVDNESTDIVASMVKPIICSIEHGLRGNCEHCLWIDAVMQTVISIRIYGIAALLRVGPGQLHQVIKVDYGLQIAQLLQQAACLRAR